MGTQRNNTSSHHQVCEFADKCVSGNGVIFANMGFHKCKKFELKLIAAVKHRPELFSFKKINSMTRRELIAAWQEISRLLRVREHLCRRRWNSLMYTFLRHCAKRVSNKSNWPYYERMSFLLQYNDIFRFFNSSNTLIVVNVKTQAKRQIVLERTSKIRKLLVRLEPLQVETEPVLHRQTMERPLSAGCDLAVPLDSTSQPKRPLFRIENVQSLNADTVMTPLSTIKNNHSPPALLAQSSTVDERWTPGSDDGDPHVLYQTIDSDEQFLKSCYTTMKRLSTRRNAFVRSKIQQLLYEAEFADENDTSSASNGF
ncbi:transcription factor Adf-1-like [Anopheles marshallii]|uniref:transcription factor Adf-1-like n=1 Tax=Anopheles marshallii TaxID=1521116 RepID=UPI00237BC6B7|nr:transcription factor Adf-1-like [Anopheles marshallii]